MSLQEFCQGVISLELILGEGVRKKCTSNHCFFYKIIYMIAFFNDNLVRICVLDI